MTARSPDEEPGKAAGEIDHDASDDAGAAKRIILGLGNPGERYAATRHNVGFRVVEELARRLGIALEGRECNALFGAGCRLVLAVPQTYMNRSGHAARCLRERRGIEPKDFLVVYDEIHLPLGTLRLRPRGRAAGHRGMESILESLGTDRVPRLRFGIGGEGGPPAGADLVELVLEPFAGEEHELVEAMIRHAADACEIWAADGAEAAMQHFNGQRFNGQRFNGQRFDDAG